MTELRKRPEVEALDEARWGEIEERIFDELDAAPPSVSPRPRAWLRAAIPIAVVVAAAAALGVKLRAAPGAPASVAPIHEPSAAATSGPSRFVTHGDASHVDLPGASLDLNPESVVVMSGDDARGWLLVLERGTVTCEVAPRHDRPPFVVQAGEVQVQVVGTHFTVAREGESARVTVARGVVRVTAKGEETSVVAGQAWPPTGGAALEPTATSAISTMPSAPRPRTATARDLYEAGMALEASRPEEAALKYREAARGEGPWAANAQFAVGRLAFDRHETRAAREALETYVRRFPRGANVEDARQLLGRIP